MYRGPLVISLIMLLLRGRNAGYCTTVQFWERLNIEVHYEIVSLRDGINTRGFELQDGLRWWLSWLRRHDGVMS
jgi:hypothetical protein